MAEIGIGSTIWVHDRSSATRYGYEWKKVTISGETRVSWEFSYTPWIKLRFPKKPNERGQYRTSPLRRGYDTGLPVLLTVQEVLDSDFVNKHAGKIGFEVQGVRSAATLRQIASLVGYSPEEEKR